jgi:hypothetical protein
MLCGGFFRVLGLDAAASGCTLLGPQPRIGVRSAGARGGLWIAMLEDQLSCLVTRRLEDFFLDSYSRPGLLFFGGFRRGSGQRAPDAFDGLFWRVWSGGECGGGECRGGEGGGRGWSGVAMGRDAGACPGGPCVEMLGRGTRACRSGGAAGAEVVEVVFWRASVCCKGRQRDTTRRHTHLHGRVDIVGGEAGAGRRRG